MPELAEIPVANPTAELAPPRASLAVRLVTVLAILIPLGGVIAAPFFLWGWGSAGSRNPRTQLEHVDFCGSFDDLSHPAVEISPAAWFHHQHRVNCSGLDACHLNLTTRQAYRVGKEAAMLGILDADRGHLPVQGEAEAGEGSEREQIEREVT